MAPHSPFFAGLFEIAVRHEIPVRVGPRPRRAGGDADEGIHVDVAVGRREGFHILAQVELDGRLAVPEHVVGDAHPRGDVVPVVPGRRPGGIEDLFRGMRDIPGRRRASRDSSRQRSRTARRPAASAGRASTDPARRRFIGRRLRTYLTLAGYTTRLGQLVHHAVAEPHADDLAGCRCTSGAGC